MAVLADLSGVRFTVCRGGRDPSGIDSLRIPIDPLGGAEGGEPPGGGDGQAVQGVTQGLGGAFQAIDGADSGQDMGGIRALAAASFEPTPRATRLQEGLEESFLRAALEQARAELAEHGGIEAGIGEFEAEEVLPVDPGADGVGGRAIGQLLDELEDGHQGQPPRCLGMPTPGRIERSEFEVIEDRPQLVTQGQTDVVSRKGRSGDAGGLIRNRFDRSRDMI